MKKAPTKEILKEFGHRVRDLRMEQGLSQEELAHLSSLDRTYIGGVERGERNLGLLNIEKIAMALSVSIAALFQNHK